MKSRVGKRSILRIVLLVLLGAVALAMGALALTNGDSPPQSAATPAQLAAAEETAAASFEALITPDMPPQETAAVASPVPSLAPTPNPAHTPAPTASPAPNPALTPAPTASPTPKPTATPTPSPTPAPTKAPAQGGSNRGVLKGKVIGLDPGHQGKSNAAQEPVAPGSSETKKKVSSGTQGAFTRVAEHKVNLAVGLLLRDMLEDAGATVYMTRTSADVDVSNVERAQLFNKWQVDLGVRLHCNGSTNASKNGAFMLVPADKEYPYYSENVRAAKLILAAYGEETGLSIERGITYRGDQTGFNWCERPIVNIEMGHMTHESDDRKLVDADFQKRMAQGIFNGIVSYFS